MADAKRTRAKPIAAAWLTLRAILPKNASATQIIETRRAFYAGADALFRAVINQLEPGEEATDNDLTLMDDIDQELRDFAVQIKNGVA